MDEDCQQQMEADRDRDTPRQAVVGDYYHRQNKQPTQTEDINRNLVIQQTLHYGLHRTSQLRQLCHKLVAKIATETAGRRPSPAGLPK